MHRMPRFRTTILIFAVTMAFVLAGCSFDELFGSTSSEPDSTGKDADMPLTITTSAFDNSAAIPAQFTCSDADISPPLSWSGAPTDTASFALIMDDPDAPGSTWVHWVIYNLPGDTTALPENITSDDDLPGDAVQGRNSWQRSDYGGPCPPSGTHRYFFKLYALDTMLDLDAGATKADVLATMEGHVLAEAQLMGTYQK